MSIGGLGSVGGAHHAHSQRLTFDKADTDKSGDINFEEFSAIGQNMPGGKSGLDSDALKSLFSAIDSDGSGAVSRSEAKTAYEKLSQAMQTQLLGAQEQYGGQRAGGPPPGPPPGGPPPGGPPDAQSIFDSSDTDSSGSLSLDEFKAGFTANAPSGASAPSDSDMDSMFSSMDSNGDGSVSQDEMQAAFQQRGPHGAGGSQNSTSDIDMTALFSQAVSAYGSTQAASSTDILNQLTALLTSA